MTYKHNDLTRIKLAPVSPFDQTETLVLSEHPVRVMAASQLPRHPIGVNARQDSDWGKLLAYVKQQGGLRALLLHVDKGALHRAKDFSPYVGILIWRDRETADEKLRIKAPNPEQWIDGRIADIRTAGLSLEQVWIHLHNEAGWGAELIEWERRAALHAIQKGARVVMLNCAVGTPEPAQIVMARPILELAATYPHKVSVGLHEYFSVYGTRTTPWYLNRWRFWETYRQQANIGPVRYLITEFGTEDIADDHPYTDKLPRTGERKHVGPVHANDAAWQATYHTGDNQSPKPYPGKDRAYYEQIVTAYSVGDYESAPIEAVLLFSWGRDNGRWDDYDIQGMTALHNLLAGWDKREKEPIVIPVPPPVEIALKPPYSALLAESTNLRTEATTDGRLSKVVGTVKVEPGKDTLVTVQEPVEPVMNDDNDGALKVYSWVRVTADLPLFAQPVTGWMAKHRDDLFKRLDGEPPVEEPEPPAEPPKEPNEVPATKDDVDKLRVEMTQYNSEKFDMLLAKIDTLSARVDAYERIMRAHHLSIENELKLVG